VQKDRKKEKKNPEEINQIFEGSYLGVI